MRDLDPKLLERERCQTIANERAAAGRPLINEELLALYDKCSASAEKMYNRLEGIESITNDLKREP